MPELASSAPDFAPVLRAVREAAREALAAGALPDLLAELERVRTEVLLSALAPPSSEPQPRQEGAPGLLTVAQVAERLGRSKSWVYKNRHSLPIVRFPTGGYAFNPRGLEWWIKRRTNGA